MRRSANGAQYDSQEHHHSRLLLRKPSFMRRSAEGATYDSQGQARSASPLDRVT